MTSSTKRDAAIRIDSLPLAAAIMASGIPITGIDGPTGKYLFIFADPAAADIARDFAIGTLEVNAREFMRTFDQLRDIIRGRVDVREVAR